ncbi:hypothetical protein ACFWEL_26775, partial [Streptomyces anulatus]|uniref:hypothetical protein n=1 Tax=Streptomyces anulatus TaxID=1892 RepID=UPI003649E11A
TSRPQPQSSTTPEASVDAVSGCRGCALCKRGGRCAPFAHAVRGRPLPLRSCGRWGRPLRARLARAVREPCCGM